MEEEEEEEEEAEHGGKDEEDSASISAAGSSSGEEEGAPSPMVGEILSARAEKQQAMARLRLRHEELARANPAAYSEEAAQAAEAGYRQGLGRLRNTQLICPSAPRSRIFMHMMHS